MSELKRVLGLPTAIATAVGIVVASATLVTNGQGFGLGGKGFIIAMAAAVIMNLFIAFSFSELSSVIPRAGGIANYTSPAMGNFMAILAVLAAYVVVSILAGSAEIAIVGIVLNQVFLPHVSPVIISTIFIAALIWINIRGVEFFSRVQIGATVIMIGSMIILGIIGLTEAGSGTPVPDASTNFNPMGLGVFGLAGLAFWLFVGIEFVTPMAEELRKPKIYVPVAMISALFIIFITDTLYGFASIKFIPMDKLAASPAPHVDAAMAILGHKGTVWIAIVSLMATLSTINTVLASVSRMLYGMAHNNQLPKIFGALHSRYKTPWFSIVILGLLCITPVWIGIATIETIVVYIMAAAISWILAYIIAHLDVIILRIKYPNIVRNFKTPLYPIPQILGIVSMVWITFNIFPDPAVKKQIYGFALTFLVITGLLSAYIVKFRMKKGLFEVEPLEHVTGETPDTK